MSGVFLTDAARPPLWVIILDKIIFYVLLLLDSSLAAAPGRF